MDPYPGQVGVPGDVDLPVEQGLHLTLVMGKENIIDFRPDLAEVFAHAVPHGHDLVSIGHRADQNGFRHDGLPSKGISRRTLATKSYRTSVVGAMIDPARASRKCRSTDWRRPK